MPYTNKLYYVGYSTCVLRTISDPPPTSNPLGHLLYFCFLKHLGRRFFPNFTVPFSISSSVWAFGLPLLLMTTMTSRNSPSSPLLQSSRESLAQNFQSSICIKRASKTYKHANEFLTRYSKHQHMISVFRLSFSYLVDVL